MAISLGSLSSSLSPSGDGIIPISEGGKTYGLTLDTIKGQIEGVLTSSFTDSSSHGELSSSVGDNSTSIDSLNQFTSSADGRLNSIEPSLSLLAFKIFFSSFVNKKILIL